MDSISVLMTKPMSPYIENQLDKRFNLVRLWDQNSETLKAYRPIIRAVVTDTSFGADAFLVKSLPKLEIISSFSVGVDKIDKETCRDRCVHITNTPDVLTDDVADIAVGLMLSVCRRIGESDRYVRSGAWKQADFKCTTKFSGKKVGIIGLGRIGSAIAKRAEAFDCQISYHSRTKKQTSDYTYYRTVLDLASNSQILVVACPLTLETRHIIDRDVIEALGPSGVLINIGRGPHVDEAELVSALVEGRLGGAGLDVFENEPEVPNELFGLDNVVLLPHVGSATIETRTAMADLVIGNLEAHFTNKPLLTPVA